MTTIGSDTIPAALASAVEKYGQRPAVVDRTSITYEELGARARRVGAALVACGVAPGERVAIWAPNSTRWIEALFGLSLAGATLVPVNTRFKGDEASVVLSRSGATTLFAVTDLLGTDLLAMLQASGVALPDLERVVVLDGPAKSDTMSWDDLLDGVTPAALAELDARAADVGPDDVADILFTSGTTGVPKGVVQTHGRTTAVARDWVAMTGLQSDDRYLMVNPYFHMFGLKAGILAAAVAGASMYPVSVFDAVSALDTVERERITVLPGAPTLYQALLDGVAADPGRDLSSLRVAVTGAADIPVPLIRRVLDELPFELVLAGYGLSEGGTATATEPGDPAEAVATTVGRARPGVELRIVDGDGVDVSEGAAGEIVLRGPTIMSHYLDDLDATTATLSSDGWLRTGDIGTVGDDGRVRIVGRANDMFIVGGFNAYPAEIENTLLRHPEIDQVAVIGVPDHRLGEVGMAFVVPVPGTAPSTDQIVEWARERMANYKVPRRVELIDALPINATGKVEKLALRELAER